MKILGIDSSSLVASVAIVEDDIMIAEYTTNFKKTHSQTLLPMIDEITKMTGISLDEIDYIAVAGGPGSFTGLRIGSATAKGLGLALKKDLVHIPTLEALAYTQFGTDNLVCPIMDARRNQVYTGLYRFQNHTLQVVKDQLPIAVDELIDTLNLLGEEVVFLGDGVPVYESVIKERIKVPYSFAPAHVNKQRASAIAVRAMEYYKSGVYENGDDFAPEYLRVSQAERERAAREQSDTSAE